MKARQIKHGGLYHRTDTKQYLVAVSDDGEIRMLSTDTLRIQYYESCELEGLIRNGEIEYKGKLDMNLRYGLTGKSVEQTIIDDPELVYTPPERVGADFIINNEGPPKLTGEAWDRFVAEMECEPRHSDMMKAYYKKEEQND